MNQGWHRAAVVIVLGAVILAIGARYRDCAQAHLCVAGCGHEDRRCFPRSLFAGSLLDPAHTR